MVVRLSQDGANKGSSSSRGAVRYRLRRTFSVRQIPAVSPRSMIDARSIESPRSTSGSPDRATSGIGLTTVRAFDHAGEAIRDRYAVRAARHEPRKGRGARAASDLYAGRGGADDPIRGGAPTNHDRRRENGAGADHASPLGTDGSRPCDSADARHDIGSGQADDAYRCAVLADRIRPRAFGHQHGQELEHLHRRQVAPVDDDRRRRNRIATPKMRYANV